MKATPQFYTLTNKNGMTMTVSSLGGIVTSLRVPDAKGALHEMILACDAPEHHHKNGYMNALIGRVGNRISQGGFALDGEFHALAQNSKTKGKRCSLHGGAFGFDQHLWNVREFKAPDGPALELTTFSPDGEENYPGNLAVRVVYTLLEENAWRIEYWAITDRPTPVNLTNHAYFNLNGGAAPISGALVWVNASHYTEVDEHLLPTGRCPSVENTALDLRAPVAFREIFKAAQSDPLVKGTKGLDHNFILDRTAEGGFEVAAEMYDEAAGFALHVETTEPCVQVYSAGGLKRETPARKGQKYGPHYGVCFETQHAPDSPNQPGFPSIRLDPGKVYHSATIYSFQCLEEPHCDCGCECHCHEG